MSLLRSSHSGVFKPSNTSETNPETLKPFKTPLEDPEFFFKSIYQFLLPLVVNNFSNRIIIIFQKLCGLSEDENKKPVIGNILLHFFFKLASTTGEEIFSLMPVLFWVSLPMAVSFSTNFGIILTAGQLLKDLLRLPRPPRVSQAGRIIKLENHFETEYGLPSTHCMSGMLPACILFFLTRQGVPFSSNWWWFAVFYASSVALSRLYLGVHSPLDLLTGGALGYLLMLLLHFYGDSLDAVVYSRPEGLVIILALGCLYLVAYPKARPWSASFGTATQIFGSWFGVALGLYILFNCSSCSTILSTLHQANQDPIFSSPSLLRILISLILIGLTKVITKKLAMILFLSLSRCHFLPSPHPMEKYDMEGREVDESKAYWVEVPVRMINYGSLAIVTILLCPYLWSRLGLV